MVSQIKDSTWIKLANGGFIKASSINVFYIESDKLIAETASGTKHILKDSACKDDIESYAHLIMDVKYTPYPLYTTEYSPQLG